MYRKVTSLMVITLVFSILVIVCEVSVLAFGRTPEQSVAGASPQAPGWQAHRVADLPPVLSSPLRPPGREGPAEWGRPTGWAAASQAPARKTGLRLVPALGRLVQRGEYSSSTAPRAMREIAGGARAAGGGKTPTLLLGAIMLLVILVVARRASAAWEEAPGKADAPQPRPPVDTRPISYEGGHPAARFVRRIAVVGDQTAEWERVRLVPT